MSLAQAGPCFEGDVPLMRLPRLRGVKVPNPGVSVELPTPSFPDIDYCAIYHDWIAEKLVLVFVQKPKSQCLFDGWTPDRDW